MKNHSFQWTWLLGSFLLGGLLLGSGCSMCCGVYDYDYPTYGGLVQRTDPSYGRVGSIFSDPNAPTGVPVAMGVEMVDNQQSPRRNSNDLQEGEVLPMPNPQVTPSEDRDKPAEELKEDLLNDLRSQQTSARPLRSRPHPNASSEKAQLAHDPMAPAAPARMTVRPTRMLQSDSDSHANQPILSNLSQRRLRGLFQ